MTLITLLFMPSCRVRIGFIAQPQKHLKWILSFSYQGNQTITVPLSITAKLLSTEHGRKKPQCNGKFMLLTQNLLWHCRKLIRHKFLECLNIWQTLKQNLNYDSLSARQLRNVTFIVKALWSKFSESALDKKSFQMMSLNVPRDKAKTRISLKEGENITASIMHIIYISYIFIYQYIPSTLDYKVKSQI